MKSRRMRLSGHVEGMEEMRNAYDVLVGYLKVRAHLEYIGLEGKIILEFIL
jgi:hypothetical protein